ncbi:MAG: amino acid adenylation domain-containing protein [Eubacteriales bacterium]
MQTNILEYLENTAARVPQKLAFSTGSEGMSFSEVYEKARAAGSYICNRGIYREPVVIFMDKHPKTVTAFFGVIYSGNCYVCLDDKMPDARITAIIGQLRPSLVVSDGKNFARAQRLCEGAQVVLFDDISDGDADAELLDGVRVRQLDTDAIYMVFTSGSTGTPKGVVACHRSVIDYTEHLSEALGFSENTVFANQTPLYFDAPLKEIMPTIKFGATTYFVPKTLFSFPVKLIQYLNEHRINTVCWVVSAFVQISSLGALEKFRPEYLTTVAFGSEVFPRRQYDIWRKALPDAVFFNLYGPTEATGMSCYWRADRELDPDEPIPIGRPFKNTEIILAHDPDGDGEGEILIRGTCLTMGYFNDPEKTSEAFVQNPENPHYPELVYRTGDIGKYNAHGELVFVCRRDSQIKHMGHRIELGEIENAALASGGADQACCLYDSEGKRIALFYTGGADRKEMLAALCAALPRYMLPAVCEKLDAMPLTDNGKTDRRKLKSMALEAQ